MEHLDLDVDTIVVKENPRKQFDQASVESLAATIERHGILQPIVVTEASEDTFVLVAGERRLRAFKFLNRKTIPATVCSVEASQVPAVQLIENLAREDLTPLDEAHAITTAHEAEFQGRTPSNDELKDWAAKLGMGPRKLRYGLNLAEASDYVQAFGRPFSIYRVRKDAEGNKVLNDDGKAEPHRHERPALDAAALRTLVKLNRVLRKHDALMRKETGKHRDIAEKTVVKLGEKASLDGWSAKRLDAEAKSVIEKLGNKTKAVPASRAGPLSRATDRKLPAMTVENVTNLDMVHKSELAKTLVKFLENAGFSRVEIDI